LNTALHSKADIGREFHNRKKHFTVSDGTRSGISTDGSQIARQTTSAFIGKADVATIINVARQVRRFRHIGCDPLRFVVPGKFCVTATVCLIVIKVPTWRQWFLATFESRLVLLREGLCANQARLCDRRTPFDLAIFRQVVSRQELVSSVSQDNAYAVAVYRRHERRVYRRHTY
jgi:hypothetical protein